MIGPERTRKDAAVAAVDERARLLPSRRTGVPVASGNLKGQPLLADPRRRSMQHIVVTEEAKTSNTVEGIRRE